MYLHPPGDNELNIHMKFSESRSNDRQIFNTRRMKSPNLNVSRLVLQLSLPKLLKPGVKWRMKM